MLMKNHGFTLIELVVTITIAGILLVWAAPSFRTVIQNNRITTQANQFLTALNTARSEAVKRGATVSICSSTDLATCSGSPSWHNGWIIFSDASGVRGALDGTDTVLKVGQAYEGNSTLSDVGGAPVFSFNSTGRAFATASFQLRIPDCTGNQARNINISLTGRAAVSKVACP